MRPLMVVASLANSTRALLASKAGFPYGPGPCELVFRPLWLSTRLTHLHLQILKHAFFLPTIFCLVRQCPTMSIQAFFRDHSQHYQLFPYSHSSVCSATTPDSECEHALTRTIDPSPHLLTSLPCLALDTTNLSLIYLPF